MRHQRFNYQIINFTNTTFDCAARPTSTTSLVTLSLESQHKAIGNVVPGIVERHLLFPQLHRGSWADTIIN